MKERKEFVKVVLAFIRIATRGKPKAEKATN